MRSLVAAMLAAALVLAAVPLGAHTHDFEREARWRAEVVPGLVVGEAIDVPGPGGRPFLALLTEPTGFDRASGTLLVIVHGIGVHPDHGIVGRLRMDLADRGFATLSLQMPVLAGDAPAEHYEPLFGQAAERIAAAAAWAHARGYRDLVLVSHSLGSRMANAYFDRNRESAYRAWVSLGLSGGFSAAFARQPAVPVLDVFGERDFAAVLKGAPARAGTAQASGAAQRVVPGADHFYAGREAELMALVAEFTRRK